MKRDPTHFDRHHHSHRTPAVLEALVTLGRETRRPVRAASPEVGDRLRREGIPTTDRFVEDFFDQSVTLEVLTDRRVREAVDRAGVRLIHFGQL